MSSSLAQQHGSTSRRSSFVEEEMPLPGLAAHERALAAATDAYAAAKAPYVEANARLQDILNQLPEGYVKDQPPAKGTAKPDPALVAQLEELSPEVEAKRVAAEEAKQQLSGAETALQRARNLAFVRIQSERSVLHARQLASSYSADMEEAKELAEAGKASIKEELQRMRKQATLAAKQHAKEEAAMHWQTNVEDFALGWRNSWRNNHPFSPPPPAPKNVYAPPPPPPEGDSEALTALKAHLGKNFIRVTELFRIWDVDCDHTVSVEELRNALLALRIPFTDESLLQLYEEIDEDKNGTLDFEELHKALKKDAPKRAPPNKICLTVPPRKEPNPLGTGAERRAVAALKRALHNNLSRVTDLFHSWDYDGNGQVSKQELRRALASQSIEVDRVALDFLYKQLDADGSGGVDFRELNRMLRREFVFETELIEATLLTPAGGIGIGARSGLAPSASTPALRRPETVPDGAMRNLPKRSPGPRPRAKSSELLGRAPPPKPRMSQRAIFEQNLQRHDHAVVREILEDREQLHREAQKLVPPPAASKSAKGMTPSRTEPELIKRYGND